MVGHDNILIQADHGVTLHQSQQFFLRHTATGGQPDLGGGKPPPYLDAGNGRMEVSFHQKVE